MPKRQRSANTTNKLVENGVLKKKFKLVVKKESPANISPPHNPRNPTSHTIKTNYTQNCKDPLAPSCHIRLHTFVTLEDAELQAVRSLAHFINSLPRLTHGAYGSIYVVKEYLMGQFRDILQNIRSKIPSGAKDRWVASIPTNKSIAIKVQNQTKKSPQNQRAAWYNEASIHKKLSPLAFIPDLYANLFTNSLNIIVMEYVKDSVPLMSVLKSDDLRRKYDLQQIKKNLNHALITIWKHGILHLDLHDNNILVQKNNKIKIVDFGLAHESNTILEKARDFNVSDNAKMLWKKHIERQANNFMFARGYDWYNPNYKIFNSITKKISADPQTLV